MSSQRVYFMRARDGMKFQIRPLGPDDAGLLVDLFDHMGAESRFSRFNLTLTNPDPELVWREAGRLAQIDPKQDGAWLAFADLPEQDEAPIAGARFIRVSPDVAEASIVVRDDQQKKGIGLQLLQFLIDQARLAGVNTLTATVQRTNRPVWMLLKKVSLPLSFVSEGNTTTISANLRLDEPGS